MPPDWKGVSQQCLVGVVVHMVEKTICNMNIGDMPEVAIRHEEVTISLIYMYLPIELAAIADELLMQISMHG